MTDPGFICAIDDVHRLLSNTVTDVSTSPEIPERLEEMRELSGKNHLNATSVFAKNY